MDKFVSSLKVSLEERKFPSSDIVVNNDDYNDFDTSTWKMLYNEEIITLAEIVNMIILAFPRLRMKLDSCSVIFVSSAGVFILSLTGILSDEASFVSTYNENEYETYIALLDFIKSKCEIDWVEEGE